jgi:hypothetical protein
MLLKIVWFLILARYTAIVLNENWNGNPNTITIRNFCGNHFEKQKGIYLMRILLTQKSTKDILDYTFKKLDFVIAEEKKKRKESRDTPKKNEKIDNPDNNKKNEIEKLAISLLL